METPEINGERYFDCQDSFELIYISGLYEDNAKDVLKLLLHKCASGELINHTFESVSRIIEKELLLKPLKRKL